MSGSPEGPFWTSDTPNTKDPEAGWLEPIHNKIRRRELEGFRPVVVAAIQNCRNEVLLLRSMTSPAWQFPQVGVVGAAEQAGKQTLDVLNVLHEGVEGITGIPRDQLDINYLNYYLLSANVSSEHKQRDWRGTNNVIFSAQHKGEPDLEVPPSHVAWVHPLEMDGFVEVGDSNEEREMMLRVTHEYLSS